MSDVIRLLPDAVANQIAAGEVIQRPASVVKELVENALDAGARHIKVVFIDAGKSCVQVIDDGRGMSETDARLSFERHATSKIRAAADLFSLHTMGFRGEALASIAAVAQVELKTRMADMEVGTSLRIEGSKVIEQLPAASAVGANFAVRNLFFNIPARRKFLKSNQTETANIFTEFERVALAHPDIAFTLYNGDEVVLQLPVGKFRQRVVGIFGKRIDSHLLPINVDTPIVQITGFVGSPESSKKKGAHQFFFANGRFMRHPYFAKAVMSAFDRLIPDGEQVPFFINFTVDPSHLDVNIHPAKTEIKFQDDQAIWQILLAAVREALGKFNAIPTLDFDTENRPAIPAFGATPAVEVHQPQVHLDQSFNPFDTHPSASHSRPVGNAWQSAFSAAMSGGQVAQNNESSVGTIDGVSSVDTPSDAEVPFVQTQSVDEPAHFSDDFMSEADLQPDAVMQFRGRFIVATTGSGLLVVDQHRAHIRILYDLYMQQLAAHKGVSQGLLFPQVIQLPPSADTAMTHLLPTLADVGFDLSPLGGGSYSVMGIPAGTEGLDPVGLLQSVVDDAVAGVTAAAQSVNHLIALALARQAAMPIGQALSAEEMNHLVAELYGTTNANYTPDGKIIQYVLTPEKLESLFD